MLQNSLDQTSAEIALRFLARYFGIKRPQLIWTNRVGGKHYDVRKQAITASGRPNDYGFGNWASLAHEFAHHLDCSIVRLNRTEWHNESFYYSLRQVLKALELKNYPWESEYRQVARWAKRDGLVVAAEVLV